MKVGDKVKLVGKTKHGKNRVKENGEFWLVENIKEKQLFPRKMSGPGPFLFLISLKSGTDDIRWVSEIDDPNFEVEPVED